MFSNPPNRHRLGSSALFLACLASLLMSSPWAAADSGLIAPEGFTVTRYAPDDLAHDIHNLTIDSLGRVVVSGPGYIKILIDRDGGSAGWKTSELVLAVGIPD
jgi:hypothetical protein